MRIIMGLMGLLLLSGCAVNLDETVQTLPVEDMAAWVQSAEAHRGAIVLGSDISAGAAVDIVRKMIALDDDPEIKRVLLIINSNGGDTGALRTIYNALRFTKKPVDTVNVGNCYSAACAIFAAATGQRYAFANAHFMVHRPRAIGGSERQYRDLLDFEVDSYESMLKDKGLPRDWFPLTNRDQYFTAQEAKDYGFLDAIVTQLPRE